MNKSISKYHQNFKSLTTPISVSSTFEAFFTNLNVNVLTHFFKTTFLFSKFALFTSQSTWQINFKNLNLLQRLWIDPLTYSNLTNFFMLHSHTLVRRRRKIGVITSIKRRINPVHIFRKKSSFFLNTQIVKSISNLWLILNSNSKRLIGTPKSIYFRSSTFNFFDKITFIKQWRRKKIISLKPFTSQTQKFLQGSEHITSTNAQARFILKKLQNSQFLDSLLISSYHPQSGISLPKNVQWKFKVKPSTSLTSTTSKFKPYLFLNLTSNSTNIKSHYLSFTKIFLNLTNLYQATPDIKTTNNFVGTTIRNSLINTSPSYIAKLPLTESTNGYMFSKLTFTDQSNNLSHIFLKNFSGNLSDPLTRSSFFRSNSRNIKNTEQSVFMSNTTLFTEGLTYWLKYHKYTNTINSIRQKKKATNLELISDSYYNPGYFQNYLGSNSTSRSRQVNLSMTTPIFFQNFIENEQNTSLRAVLWHISQLHRLLFISPKGGTTNFLSSLLRLFTHKHTNKTNKFLLKYILSTLPYSLMWSAKIVYNTKKNTIKQDFDNLNYLKNPYNFILFNPRLRKKKSHFLFNKNHINKIIDNNFTTPLKPTPLNTSYSAYHITFLKKRFLKKMNTVKLPTITTWQLQAKQFTFPLQSKVKKKNFILNCSQFWRQRTLKRFTRYIFKLVQKSNRTQRFSLPKTTWISQYNSSKNYLLTNFKLISLNPRSLIRPYCVNVLPNSTPISWTPSHTIFKYKLLKHYSILLNKRSDTNYLANNYVFFKPQKSNYFHNSPFFYVQFLSLLKNLPQLRLASQRSLFYYEPYDFINLRQLKKTVFQRLIARKYRMDKLKSTQPHTSFNWLTSDDSAYLQTYINNRTANNNKLFSNFSLSSSKESLYLTHVRLGLMYSHINLEQAAKKRFIKKTRFKPGYPRIWRTERKVLKQALHLTHRYQYRLTKKIQYRYFPSRQFRDNFFELKLEQVLLFSSFASDDWTVKTLLQHKYVYLNGTLTTNGDLRLFLNDFIQLIVTLRFYVLFKWIKNATRNRFTKWLKKYYKTYRVKRQLFREFTFRELPDAVLTLKNSWYDIPKNIEIDYFTLSIFVIQNTYGQNLLNQFPVNFFKIHILNVYNWKYLT